MKKTLPDEQSSTRNNALKHCLPLLVKTHTRCGCDRAGKGLTVMVNRESGGGLGIRLGLGGGRLGDWVVEGACRTIWEAL